MPGGTVAVLVSGQGSILEAMVAEGVPVALVLADRPCRGIEWAKGAGLSAHLVDRADFGGFGPDFDRDTFTTRCTEVLELEDPTLVAMAGFGTIFSPSIFERFGGRMLNTHPSLLPAFPGWHAVRDALEAKAVVTGCTVHLATEVMDVGPILSQGEVVIDPRWGEAELHEAIKTIERSLYPATIKALLADHGRREAPRGERGGAT